MEDILDRPDHDQDINIKDWNLFIGKEATYYIPKWMNIKSGSMLSFNIAPFILGIFWMLYRKMYLASFIWMVILVISGFIEEEVLIAFGLGDAIDAFTRISNLFYATFLGLLGNWIYLKSTERKISKLKSQGLGEMAYEEALQKTGGTSLIPPIVATLAFVGLVYFLDTYPYLD